MFQVSFGFVQQSMFALRCAERPPSGRASWSQLRSACQMQFGSVIITEFEISPYGSFFRVGEARLGLDTQLGESRRFVAMLLGSASLAQSYLGAPYPFDIADRMVLDRDRLGNLPAL